MATVYANAADGYIDSGNQSSHANARGASSGTASTSSTSVSEAVRYFKSSGRGATAYFVRRVFLWFDTSGITGTLSEATLKVYPSVNACDIIAVKSDAFGGDGSSTLANADFNNVDFSTAYSAEIPSGDLGAGAYRDIALNSTALADMKNNDVIIISLINYHQDHLNTEPGIDVNIRFGMHFTDFGGTSRDPYIDYTVATGYGNSVIGVAAGNIGKIIGKTKSTIDKMAGK